MFVNNFFKDILSLIAEHRLGKVLSAMENYFLSYPHLQDGQDELASLKEDYSRMMSYWQRGFEDPQRSEVFSTLLHRLYVLCINVAIHERMRNSLFLSKSHARARSGRRNWSTTSLQQELEGYVQDVAFLQLEPEQLRQEKSELVYKRHQELLNDLFDYIWTSRLWKDSLTGTFEELLLSPTIDTLDQQLIVSAITLSAMNAFDMNKFKVLAHVYEKASDEQLRQRALVGWVLCADASAMGIYDEMHATVRRLCQDERCRQELAELQMQMVYCMQAEEDTRKIQEEIMPELMRDNNMKMTRKGLVEEEEDQMEDILHPDAAEEKMERLERNMHRMADMQRQGSDIYFGGFSQMKRFPFFRKTSNWLMPFYPQHPEISRIWNEAKAKHFLHSITKVGAFCDSDRYSFVLAFDTVVAHLPEQMVQMVDHGEAAPIPIGGEFSKEEQEKPAFMRRIYLQDLFRFFRLFPQREEFRNAFNKKNIFFFSSALFRGTALEKDMTEMARFLLKHKEHDAAFHVINNVGANAQDVSYHLLMGHLLMHQNGNEDSVVKRAIAHYEKALQLVPDNRKALMGHARALFADRQYKEACDDYRKLLALTPENRSVLLNMAVSLIQLNQHDEAHKLLYKLNYTDADDEQANRVLAWSLALDGRYEQARHLYDRLLAVEQPHASDILNYGYCLWFAGDVKNAVEMMQRYVALIGENAYSRLEEELASEQKQLHQHGISDIDIQLMLDSVKG